MMMMDLGRNSHAHLFMPGSLAAVAITPSIVDAYASDTYAAVREEVVH